MNQSDVEKNGKNLSDLDSEKSEEVGADVKSKEASNDGKPLWCSWCMKKVPHELSKSSWIYRNTYKCTNCYNLTAHCMKCNVAMARKFGDYTDKLCISCDLTISNWESSDSQGKIPEDMKTDGWCSWCFNESTHYLYRKSFLTRNSFQCQKCNKSTIKCRKCNEGMARISEGYSDQLCAKCDGTVTDWNNVDKNANARLVRKGWCSWCFEECNHTLEHRNMLFRNSFTCDNCGMRTVGCIKCDVAMARGGAVIDNYICAHCSQETKKIGSWKELKEKKDHIVCQQRDKERVIAELRRESSYRDAAKKEGLLRPFLLLVAMPTIFRNQVASFLGWTIFTKEYFGDPHAESWQILHANMSGMQARCNKSYEKLNPFASNCNWYDILVRVSKSSFHKDLSKNIPWKETSARCNNSHDSFIQDIEEEFIVELGKMMKSHMTEEQRQALKESMKSEESELAKRLIIQNAGVTRKESLQYAYNITNKVFGVSAYVKGLLAEGSTKALISMGGSTVVTSVVAPLSAQLALLSTPMFVFGLVGLTKTGINIVFGSSEGRLFVPVTTILNQRILLAAEGIKLEDYY